MATSHNGRRIHVDDNVEDEWTGHLSKYWGQNLYCDCIAVTPCACIRISNPIFNNLIKDKKLSALIGEDYREGMTAVISVRLKNFRLFFYFKMSSRLYDMYRRRLSYDLFTPRQRFAAHLILDAEDNDCYMENVSKTCDELGISRRNLYNIISDFEALKIISYEQTGLVSIRDREQLRNIAQPALEFNENRD